MTTFLSVLLACCRLGRIAILFSLFAVGGAAAQMSSSSKIDPSRVALVIGNAKYRFAGELRNPGNDAGDMAAALRKLGFKVIEGRDLDKAGMDRRIRDFAEALVGAEVGVFFYAGHALQESGHNYLVPVDAQIKSLGDLDFETVRLDLVQRQMENQTKTNILFLDACRDNPLARNLARAMGTRSANIGRGLARIESGAGTLVSFSTQPGNVALDGDKRNSPFTTALLTHLATPGKDLGATLIAVRNDVSQATGDKQVPWEQSALTRLFYFNPGPTSSAGGTELPGGLVVRNDPCAGAEAHWRSVEAIGTVAAYRDHSTRFPNCALAGLANAKIDELSRPPDPCVGVDTHWRSTQAVDTLAAYKDHKERYSGCVFSGLASAKIDALSNSAKIEPLPKDKNIGGPFVPVAIQRTTSIWDHNGSLMTLEAEGAERKFKYYQPRAGMRQAGADPGALLFSGQKADNSYSGTAYIFSARCGKFPYQVTGTVSSDSRTIVMNGRRPRVDSASCTISNYESDKLVFEFKQLQ